MQVKTILNRVHKQPGFVYGKAKLVSNRDGSPALHVHLEPRKGSNPVCSGCDQKRPTYDHLPTRWFEFVPLWAIAVFFVYTPRRADCKKCGPKVELLPWAEGKSQITTTYAWFLASWAKVLTWKETAKRFGTSWQTVFASVKRAVEWGRAHLNLDGIHCIGVDELSWSKGHKYLTMVYQIDHHCTRLLWIGRDRTAATFGRFFDWLREERSKAIQFVASDMWKAFLGTVARRANSAVHVLDRFHVMQLFSKALDEVRRSEARQLRAKGDTVTLKQSRWALLKRKHHLTEKQTGRLAELLKLNLRTVRAYLLKELFHSFWGYASPGWAGKFLDRWTNDAVRSRIEPMAKLARTLPSHRKLLLNWFRARHAFAAGAVEGLNLKARVTTRSAYGFRTYEHAEIALYHRLGKLPEPPWLTHKFA
jgi:transposase